MIFQDFQLFPASQRSLPTSTGAGPRAARSVDPRTIQAAICFAVGLQDHAEKYLHQLGGQKQRVAIARALAKLKARRRDHHLLALDPGVEGGSH
ncbi:MAG: hypothetical protein U0744_20165 [Gemmataceae bacterium]